MPPTPTVKHPVHVEVQMTAKVEHHYVTQGEIIQVAGPTPNDDYIAMVVDTLRMPDDSTRLVVLHPEGMRGQVWTAQQPVAVRKFFTRMTLE